MIASAMQIMNMIAFAMGPCSTKASAKASIVNFNICPLCGKRGKRVRLCYLSFRPVCVPVPSRVLA